MIRTCYFRTITLLMLTMMAAASVAVLAGYGTASAQSLTTNTIFVNTTNDENTSNDGKCSLREAIQNANDNAKTSPDCKAGSATGEDSIAFEKRLSGTIVLNQTLGPLSVTDPAGLSVNGGQAKITVSGDDKTQVISESQGAKLALRNLTIANGFVESNGPNDPGFGGGIENDGGTLTVSRSTFSGNKTDAAGFGGGIANINGGTLEVANSTFSGNVAGTAGGGILNSGTLEVTYSTLSDNAAFVGGGIDNANAAGVTTTLSNTILAKNEGGNVRNVCAGSSCQGTITDGGYNISDDSSFKFTNPTSKNDTDPELDPDGLQSNGGPTQTIALQKKKGSPAIGEIPKGTNGCGTTIKTDQRGVTRPQGERCDIGAFEVKKR